MNAGIHLGWQLSLLLTVAACVGCNGSQTAKVEGKVTYQGQVVPKGTVVIQDQKGVLHSANLKADGTFSVVGVGLGPVQVAVQVPQHLLDQAAAIDSLEEAKQAQGGEEETLREAEVPTDYVMPIPIPEKYNSVGTSGLAYELTSNSDTWKLNIDLQ